MIDWHGLGPGARGKNQGVTYLTLRLSPSEYLLYIIMESEENKAFCTFVHCGEYKSHYTRCNVHGGRSDNRFSNNENLPAVLLPVKKEHEQSLLFLHLRIKKFTFSPLEDNKVYFFST